MSAEEQKPVVEEPVAAPVETTPAEAEVTPAAAVAESSATAPTGAPTTEAATTTEAPIEAVKDEALKKDFAGEGTLGYKAPVGFIKKLAGFQKRFFWFGDEAVEPKNLHNYLRGEKPEVANHNAAWSSQTGKGLLYFSKHASERTTPIGIINLADVTDITEEGAVDFFFHIHGQKHVFQATHLTERDTWVAALKPKVTEAKEMVESITSSAGYKEHHTNLGKTVATGAGVAGAAKAVETKKEEKAEAKADKKEEKIEAKTDKKEEKLEAKEAAKDRKSRSQSRKRNSIFGGFGLGKKEEHAEKAEAKEAIPTETPIVAAPATETPAGTTAAPIDGPAIAAAAVAAPLEPTPAETAPAAPAEESKPAAAAIAGGKRNSIFGSFRLGSKKSEAAPAIPAKDIQAAGTEAPVIPAPEAQEPLAASVVSPATAPTEVITNGAAPAETAEATTETKVEAPAEPKPSGARKASLPFGLGKKEKAEGETEKPFFAKLRQTVRGKSPKAAEKPVEKTEDKAAEPEAEASKETPVVPSEPAAAAEPIVAEPAVANHTTPQVSATA